MSPKWLLQLLPVPEETTHMDVLHTVSYYGANRAISSHFLQFYKHIYFSNCTSGTTIETGNNYLPLLLVNRT